MKMQFIKTKAKGNTSKPSLFFITRNSFTVMKKTLFQLSTFSLLLLIYIFSKVIAWFTSKKYFPQKIKSFGAPLANFYTKAIKLLDNNQSGNVSRITLIELSIRNMKAKKTRTLITIGGMAIGIGATVFLVSIGYGLQQLVISRVARLDELKQVDVTIQPGSKVKINDKTLADFKQTPKVAQVLPMIAVVGRVNFNNSVSDMAVYGVTSDYLKQSAIQPVTGKIFESNELVTKINNNDGTVAGVSTTSSERNAEVVDANSDKPTVKIGEEIQEVEFTFTPGAWSRVREKPSVAAKIIGYTKRQEGKAQGNELWGDSYPSEDGSGDAGISENGQKLGKWIELTVPLWDKKECKEGAVDCEEGSYTILRDGDNAQVQKLGYIAELNLSTLGTSIKEGRVLGTDTTAKDEEAETTAVDADTSSSLEFIEIASEAATIKTQEIKRVALGSVAKREAILNRAMLKILGLKESEALGKEFTASFIATGDGLGNSEDKIESVPAKYTIIGVTPDEKTPVFYVPFIDLRSLGITNYSQVKVVMKNSDDLPQARRQVEALGFATRSVADTVSQINSLFSTARTVLALLGMVALSVAALGMFNTLTVSLLERTREVGLMKAMGMKSYEVKELFLTESMIMGFFGGILGLLIGFVGGKTVGVLLSIFAISQGAGFIDISYIPPLFIILILFLSLFVGLITGIYPARRATNISALNALRYE